MPKKKLKSAVFWKLLTLENKVYALVILYTIVGKQLKVELFKPKLFWVCLAFLIVWHFTVIYIKSSRCMGQTVLWTDFWWCGNSSILKAFSFLLPRKKCCGQKKRENVGTCCRIHCPIFCFVPTYSAKQVRIAETIWKENGNSLHYRKGFCSKEEFLSLSLKVQSISLKAFRRGLSFEGLSA